MKDDFEAELREQLHREAAQVPDLPRPLRVRIRASIEGNSAGRRRSVSQVPQLAFAALAGLLIGLLLLGLQNRRAVIEVLPSSIRQIVAPTPELPAFTCSDHRGGRSGLSAQLTAIRSARQEGFDRLVFEFNSGVPSYEVTRQATADFTWDSANPVSLDGAAGVRVLLHSTD
ncbi:MAG: hypothetical protein M3Z13_04275, partial [Candidatus Dormibacteraeota bacterium]|nr:hypothetical protein [Candidatus Dormibacteraeota bacterium]